MIKRFLAFMAGGIAVFCLCGLSQPRLTGQEKVKEPERRAWEYAVRSFADEKELNRMGEEGWEVCAATTAPTGARHVYLKRSR